MTLCCLLSSGLEIALPLHWSCCALGGEKTESGEESSRRTCAYTSFQLLSVLGPVVAGGGKDSQAGFIKACWLRC